MTGSFELFEDERGCFRFRIAAPDGAVMALSRDFPDKRSAVAGIEAVREYAGMGLITDQCPGVPLRSADAGDTGRTDHERSMIGPAPAAGPQRVPHLGGRIHAPQRTAPLEPAGPSAAQPPAVPASCSPEASGQVPPRHGAHVWRFHGVPCPFLPAHGRWVRRPGSRGRRQATSDGSLS